MTIRIDQLNPTVSPDREHEFPAMINGITVKLRLEQVLAIGGSDDPQALKDFSNVDPATGRAALDLGTAALATVGTSGGEVPTNGQIPETREVGRPFPVIDGAPLPDNSGVFKYVVMTAGESGVGGYNEGLLTDEDITGSGPSLEATAEIVVGPMQGTRIHLWNTEGRYPKPGVDPGTVGMDQMQLIEGTWANSKLPADGESQFSGALSEEASLLSDRATTAGSSTSSSIKLNSANSPDARTGDRTDVKHEQVTYCLRVA